MTTLLRSRREKLPRLPFDRAFGRFRNRYAPPFDVAFGRPPLRFGGPENHTRVRNGHPPIMTGQGPEGSYPRDNRVTTVTLPAKAAFAADDSEFLRFYYRDHDAEEFITAIFDKDGGGLPPGAGFAINLATAVTASDVATAVDAVLNGPGLTSFFEDHGVDIDVNIAAATVTIREVPERTMLETRLPATATVAFTTFGNYLADVAPLRAGPVVIFHEVAVE